MLIEAARRAEAAVKEMLAIADDGAATADEFRNALAISRSFMAVGSAFQTSAVEVIARVERHGDGGAEVLAGSVGLSRNEARSRVKTAAALTKTPKLRERWLRAGTGANAKRLPSRRKTSAQTSSQTASCCPRRSRCGPSTSPARPAAG